jgi:ribosomal protein L12E/L44/L45/RPP1/RPP2
MGLELFLAPAPVDSAQAAIKTVVKKRQGKNLAEVIAMWEWGS